MKHRRAHRRACAPFAGCVGALIAFASGAAAQSVRAPADTTPQSAEVAAVKGTWLEYLASKQGEFSARAGTPSPLWLRSEQERWPVYDLAGFYLADGATPEVLDVARVPAPDGPGADEYRITSRFRSGDPSVRPATWWSSMTVTVYAVRDGDRWLLSNALPRNTRTWLRDTVGPITYVHAPDYPYDAARARRAVAFVDSVAAAFSLPRLSPLTYYLASSVDEVYAIMGLESAVKYGPTGGASQPVNRQLFSGIPVLGEEYRHELAHFLFAPLCCARTAYIVSEGVATWLGGTSGMDFPTAARALAAYLAEHPAVTVDSLLTGGYSAAQLYPAGAVLTAWAHEQGGVAAVKLLFDGGSTSNELRATLERLLRRPWPQIAEEWRRRAIGYASRDTALARDTTRTSAAAIDAAYLRRAQAPGSEREARWMRADWKDPSPHRAGAVEANGQHLQVLDWGGHGPPLVFLPGMSHTGHIFDELAPRFADRFHVLALTLRGHGASSAPSHPYTVDSLAADVRGALAALRLPEAILVGHSLGGHVANRVAALYPGVVSRVIYLDAAKDSTGLAALRAAAPTSRPQISEVGGRRQARAHDLQRLLYFNFWSDAQEADARNANTAPEIPAMADLYALQDWRSVRQPQLDVCALDTPAVQFPWLDARERSALGAQITRYVVERFVPWERAGCERFAREAPNGTLVIVPNSNHYVFLVSPEQTYVAMRQWLERQR